MSNKFSNIKERVLYLIENKGYRREEFFNIIGMTYGNFTGKAKETPLNSNAISNILLEIPDLNVDWLITGKGSMLKSEIKEVSSGPSEPNTDYKAMLKMQEELIEYKNKEIELLKKENEELKRQIRLPSAIPPGKTELEEKKEKQLK